MLRTRVIQTLFAYYKDPGKTPLTARKELLKSFADTYDLYFVLLDFVNSMNAYAQQQLEEQAARARATHREWKANKRFVDNRLAQQLFDNRALRARVQEQNLSWDSGMSAVSAIYKQMVECDFFRNYMEAKENTYADDKMVWRRIYENLLIGSSELAEALDEMEVTLDKSNWTVDADVVISYVIKTIKRFNEDSTLETELLPMFDGETELKFATDLLDAAIRNHSQYEELINNHLKGWDADRIAYMDRIILETALAEIMEFDSIALTVSLNEYIELAKEYSGDKSYQFINGILNEILREMKHDNSLLKANTLR